MVTKQVPEFSKVYFIEKHTAIHILKGTGRIEVDFRTYRDWSDKLIFLDKGQYIKFLSADFLIRKIEFEDEARFHSKSIRVLFKHLVSLGYIDFDDCEDCSKYLTDTALSTQAVDIIDVSTKQWYWQNPFRAEKEEYHLIFDAKEIVDIQYRKHLKNEDIAKLLSRRYSNVHRLYTDKIGITIKTLLKNKRLLESKKEVAFTDKSIKEIAYDFGFKDPAYFNRSFKGSTGKTPLEFREHIDLGRPDSFIPELYELINNFHTEQRKVDFYAKEMHTSVKTLSRKVREKLNISIGQLIRQELIVSAKKHLRENHLSIQETAFELGFEEPNHFSAFFKTYTGLTPTDFKSKKYNQ